jgi:TRAP-type mannitol/chloroaromatic compound transport system permease large subunit
VDLGVGANGGAGTTSAAQVARLRAALGVPRALSQAVSDLPVPPWVIMILIVGFYLALGTFMEGFSMIVTTIPVIFPVVKALGYDPVWFGVMVTMLVDIDSLAGAGFRLSYGVVVALLVISPRVQRRWDEATESWWRRIPWK